MTPERYQQVKSILQAALELDGARRTAFVESACAGDEELTREVQSLIEHDAQTETFLESPAIGKLDWSAGSHIARYRIVGPIGAGEMGEVYRAHDPSIGRDVAIKFLPRAFALDSDRVARFQVETRAAGSLNHPNILTVHDCGNQHGIPFIVSELLHGETLRQRMERGPIHPDTAVAYAAQVARGLGAAHGRSILHRDLKPENLFVTRDGAVKILDFGLAKAPDPPGGSPVRNPTEPGMVMGTAGYMAPEQIRAETVDRQADIFSLGVILHEMICGQRPFQCADWAEEMNAILHADPPELPAALHGLPDRDGLARILLRCLAKQPADRYESARDLAFALESLRISSAPKPRGHRLRQVLLVAAGLLLAAGAVLAVYAIGREPPPASFQRLTFRRGIVSAARFTRDAGTVVYSAAWDENDFHLYFTRPGSPGSQNMGYPGDMLFAVSSQGDLALCHPTSRTEHAVIGTLARVAFSGGGWLDRAYNVAAADWSPDGSQLAAVRVEGERWQIEYPLSRVLYRAPSSGGYIDALRVAPRGDAIAFLEHPLLDDAAGAVAVVDLAGRHRALSGRFNSMRGLAWSPDGSEVWFAATKRGVSLAIWAVTRSGRERLIARLPSYVSLEDIAPDGRVLLSVHALSEDMILVPERGPQVHLYWHDESQVRDLSADGSQILFSESGDATRQDYDAYLRRSDPAMPAVPLGLGLPLALSPDGRWSIVNPAGSAPAQFTLLPTGTGESRKLTSDNFSHVGAAWLPDGNSFVFAGNAPGENLRYYRQPVEGGPPTPLTDPSIHYERRSPIVLSPDGRFVAAVAADHRIQVYPTGGGPGKTVPGTEGFTPLQWCSSPGQPLIVHRYDVPPPRLWKVDVATGRQTLWKELSPPNPVGLLDVTPIRVSQDCRSFAFSPLNVDSQVLLVSGLR